MISATLNKHIQIVNRHQVRKESPSSITENMFKGVSLHQPGETAA